MKTLVIGASSDISRYSNIAVKKLKKYGHEVVAIGKSEDMIDDTPILINQPKLENIHTVTLYVNPIHQKSYYNYILRLNPCRIIFNPGTENEEFVNLAKKNGIETIEACTLVMLSTGMY